MEAAKKRIQEIIEDLVGPGWRAWAGRWWLPADSSGDLVGPGWRAWASRRRLPADNRGALQAQPPPAPPHPPLPYLPGGEPDPGERQQGRPRAASEGSWRGGGAGALRPVALGGIGRSGVDVNLAERPTLASLVFLLCLLPGGPGDHGRYTPEVPPVGHGP